MSSSRARSARFPLFVLRLSLALGLALSLWPGGPAEATVTYRVAIDREYEPYEFVDEAGQVQGFTPALLNAIGEAAGVRFEFMPMAWPEAVTALDSGAVDLVNMIVTSERATHYEFSQPHSQIVQAIFRNTNANDIVSLESLAGKTVAFQSAGVALERLIERTDINRHLVQSKLEGLLQVNIGQAQAFICAQPAGVRLVSEYQLTNVELAVADLFPQAYAFAARKGNTTLIALLDEHLARLRASGELETLTTHWLKGQLPQPTWLEKNQSSIFLLGGILLLSLLAIWIWSITLRREVRRQTQALRESEARFRHMADTAPVLIWLAGADKLRTYFNQPWLEFTGHGLEEELGHGWAKGVQIEDYARCRNLYLNAFEAREKFQLEYRLRRADGEYRWVVDNGVPRFTATGEFLGYIGSCLDITERKRAEAALHENVAILQSIFDNGQVMMGVIEVVSDDDARYVAVNSTVGRFLGHSLDAIHGRLLSDLNVPPAIRRLWVERYHESQTAGRPISFEYQRETPAGGRWVLATVHVIAPPRYSFVMLDITERKRMEDALRESEARYRLLAENMADVVWVLSVSQMKFTYLSPSVQRLRGYTVEEVLAQPMEEVLTPASLAKLGAILPGRLRQFQADAPGARFFTDEMEQPHKNGSIVSTEVTTSYVHNAHGEIEIIGVSRDITERKRAEEALRESEARFRRIAENMPVLLDAFSADNRLLLWNRECERVTGYPAAELVDNPRALEILYPDPAYRESKLADFALLADEYRNVEWEVTCKDGQKRTIAWSSISQTVAIPGWNTWGVGVDVTERKRMEEALRDAAVYTRSLIEASLDPLVTINIEGKITDVNRATESVTGVSREWLIGRDFSDYFTEPEKARAGYQQVFADSLVTDYPLAIRHVSGRITEVLYNASVYRNEAGAVLGVFAAARDITERKRAEEALRASEARQRAILNAIPDLMVVLSYPEGVYLDYHTPDPALLLAPPNQLLGHRMDEFLSPELALELTEALRQAVETGQSQVRDYEIDTPRGRLLEEARVVAIDSAHVLFVFRDVTARKQAEAQVQASLREKEVLLKEVHHRVKNNLQVMVSLLNLQAEQIRDPHSLAVFRDSQERVRSMALVHEKLYQSPDLARINFAEYLAELAGNLKQIFGLQPEVGVCVEAEEVWLGVDTAIPCGLIVNELVSNALKYAYPDGRVGMIRVMLRAMPTRGREFQLTVSDDGVGLPPALDPAHTQSLGLQLVHLLTHQLRGTVAVKREGGVTFDITFAERKEYRP